MPEYRDLFKGTGWYYARFRPGFPDELFDLLRKRFSLDGSGRLLDLGCGTGQLALPLAKDFAEVVGMDPEPEMLAEAEALAKEGRVNNVKWVAGGSGNMESLRFRLGEFRLAVMGRSFHWMDRDATLQSLAKMIDPGGGIAIVGDTSFSTTTNEWNEVLTSVIRRWLGEARRAGSSSYVVPQERHEVVIARSPFRRIEMFSFDYQRKWDVEGITGYLYSTSYCSPAILAEKRAPFEEDLRRTLLAVEPSGVFKENVQLEAILAWRDDEQTSRQ